MCVCGGTMVNLGTPGVEIICGESVVSGEV